MLDGLQNGGPAGLIYGFLFVWCGASFQTLVMAELASMYVETCPDILGLCVCCSYHQEVQDNSCPRLSIFIQQSAF